MYRLVEQGHVDPSRYVQIGLRGYWPGEKEFGWQHERGITSMFMHDVREFGIRSVIERTLPKVGAGPVFLSVDVDVLDPAFAPGTGTPEPGGMSSPDLLWACREICSRVDLWAWTSSRSSRRRRLGRHHRAGRGPDRPRDPHGRRCGGSPVGGARAAGAPGATRGVRRRLERALRRRVRVRSSCLRTTLQISLRISGGPLALTWPDSKHSRQWRIVPSLRSSLNSVRGMLRRTLASEAMSRVILGPGTSTRKSWMSPRPRSSSSKTSLSFCQRGDLALEVLDRPLDLGLGVRGGHGARS